VMATTCFSVSSTSITHIMLCNMVGCYCFK
jgi:hypothetical protein